MKYVTVGISLDEEELDSIELIFMCNTCLDTHLTTPPQLMDGGTPLCMNEGCEGFDSETDLTGAHVTVKTQQI